MTRLDNTKIEFNRALAAGCPTIILEPDTFCFENNLRMGAIYQYENVAFTSQNT
jgi:hypothetical protein